MKRGYTEFYMGVIIVLDDLNEFIDKIHKKVSPEEKEKHISKIIRRDRRKRSEKRLYFKPRYDVLSSLVN